jgi:predicted enzyme related to lactoylglutathione lyase
VVIRRTAAIHRPPGKLHLAQAPLLLRRRWIPARAQITMQMTMQWLPYVEVDKIEASTEYARQLGASVLLVPREGPAGWRSVISAPQCGELALWQPKR